MAKDFQYQSEYTKNQQSLMSKYGINVLAPSPDPSMNYSLFRHQIMTDQTHAAAHSYEGEINEEGRRHGEGKFTFSDGSYY